jgi:hypothetical protein
MKALTIISRAAAIFGISLLAATAVYAQEGGGTSSTNIWTTDFQKAFMSEKMMHMMDMSHKGMVSREDYNQYMSKVFDMMDKGHKGMLDKDDFTRNDSGSTDIWTTDFQKTFRTLAMPGREP